MFDNVVPELTWTVAEVVMTWFHVKDFSAFEVVFSERLNLFC